MSKKTENLIKILIVVLIVTLGVGIYGFMTKNKNNNNNTSYLPAQKTEFKDIMSGDYISLDEKYEMYIKTKTNSSNGDNYYAIYVLSRDEDVPYWYMIGEVYNDKVNYHLCRKIIKYENGKEEYEYYDATGEIVKKKDNIVWKNSKENLEIEFKKTGD